MDLIRSVEALDPELVDQAFEAQRQVERAERLRRKLDHTPSSERAVVRALRERARLLCEIERLKAK